jgi:hypothetical protein
VNDERIAKLSAGKKIAKFRIAEGFYPLAFAEEAQAAFAVHIDVIANWIDVGAKGAQTLAMCAPR